MAIVKKKKKIKKSTLNQRSYIGISAWTLRERFSANLCTDAPWRLYTGYFPTSYPGLFPSKMGKALGTRLATFGLHVPVMTQKIRQK